MKKRVLGIVVALIMLVSMCGCSLGNEVKDESQSEDSSMFVRVERTGAWAVVYHKETGVMYAVSCGSYNYGTFTLLVDPEGKPLIWKDERESD